MVAYILNASKIFYGITIKDARKLAYKATQLWKITCPAKWKQTEMASREWYYAFMARHPHLVLRTPEQISANRIKAFNRTSVAEFYENLAKVFVEHPNIGLRIYNMDESGFPTVPTKVVKVLAGKGSKRVSQFASAERGTNVSVAVAVDVVGNKIPPFFIFPRKKIQSHYLLNASAGSKAFGNDSGWMTKNEFDKWMDHFIEHANCRKGVPTLLLLDNHTSHTSLYAIQRAIENDIIMLSFPPHCSHKLQPLDIGIFGPTKTTYNTLVDAWCKSNAGQTFEIYRVADLVCQALNLHVTATKVEHAFDACGIKPFNPLKFTDADFLAADTYIARAEQAERELNVEQAERELERERDDGRAEREFDDEFEDDPFMLNHDDDVACNVEVSTSEPSTSRSQSVASGAQSRGSVASTSGLDTMDSVLQAIGPIQFVPRVKKSNRGRKPGKSAVLTSPQKLSELQKSAEKRALKATKTTTNAKKKTPAKRKISPVKKQKATVKKTPTKKANAEKKIPAKRRSKKKKSSTDTDEESNACSGCGEEFVGKQTAQNFIKCHDCNAPYHLSCATKSKTYSVFVCKNCDSEFSEDEVDESDE